MEYDWDYFTPPNTGSSISSSHLYSFKASFDINVWSLISLPVIKVGLKLFVTSF